MGRPHRHHFALGEAGATAAIALAVIAMAVIVTIAGSAPTDAQSRPVNVEIAVSPDRPRPGDDVTVEVYVIGCPPAAFDVEAYLVSSDGSTQSAALMARTTARPTLLWGSRATVVIPDALEGWYGIRVQCGSFRPPRLPMSNTTFSVGSNVTKQSTTDVREVPVGGTFNYLGNGCPGSIVDYDVTQTERRQTAFEADGSFDVEQDGTWGGEVTLDDAIIAGSADIRARCSVVNQYGEIVYLYYVLTGGFTVVEG